MIPIEVIQRDARTMAEEAFLLRHRSPAFLLQPGRSDPLDGDPPTTRIRRSRVSAGDWLEQTLSDEGLPPPPDPFDAGLTPLPPTDQPLATGATHVVFVQKSETNPSPFPNMITLGRMPTNDITLPFSAISKVHALLLEGSPGEWFIQDQNSTNGTWVGSARLQAGQKGVLEDGAWINLGATLGLKFLLADSLYGFLR